MALVNNGEVIGKQNKDLILETAGRLYVKVHDRYYEIDFRNLGNMNELLGREVEQETISEKSETKVEQEPINLDNYITSEDLKNSLKNYVTNRSWQDVVNTQSALQNAVLNNFTPSINPITVQTMQLTVGSEQLQYDVVNSLTDMTLAKQAIVVDDDGDGSDGEGIIFTPCCIKHYTLGSPDRVQDYTNSGNTGKITANEKDTAQYWRWIILNSDNKACKEFIDLSETDVLYVYFTVSTKDVTDDTLKQYDFYTKGVNSWELSTSEINEMASTLPDYEKYWAYVGNDWKNDDHCANEGLNLIKYHEPTKPEDEFKLIKDSDRIIQYGPGLFCKTGIGHVQYSEEALPYEDNGNYNLLYAIVTNSDGSPSISTMNGFTEITPGQVRAYMFASPKGDSYIDFKNNQFKFGNKLFFDGKDIYLNGAFIQRSGTIIENSGQPMIIYQGFWINSKNYFVNDLVKTTKEDGSTLTYICIKDCPATFVEDTEGNKTYTTISPNKDSEHWMTFAEGVNGRDGTSITIKNSVSTLSELCLLSPNIGDSYLWGQYLFIYVGSGNGNVDEWDTLLPANWNDPIMPCTDNNAWYCSGKFQGDPGKDGVSLTFALTNPTCDVIVGNGYDLSKANTSWEVYYMLNKVTAEITTEDGDWSNYVDVEILNNTISITNVKQAWNGTIQIPIKATYSGITGLATWTIDYDDDGNNIKLESDGTVFVYDPNSKDIFPNTITIKPIITGGFDSYKWEIKYDEGEFTNINDNNISINGNIVIIQNNIVKSHKKIELKYTGTLTNGNTDYDSISIYKVANGDGYLLHTKWANLDSNGTLVSVVMNDNTTQNLKLSFTSTSGEDPGEFIGQYTDSTVPDVANITNYKWRQWNGKDGQDGFGTEQIFKLSSIALNAPTFADEKPGVTEEQFNTYDHVPNGWQDSPIAPTETQSCYVSTRRLNKSTEWSKPVIYSSYTKAIYHIESNNESDILNINDSTGEIVSDFTTDFTLFGSYGDKKCLIKVEESNISFNGITFKYDTNLVGNSFYVENNWNGKESTTEEFNNPKIFIKFAKGTDLNKPIVLSFQTTIWCKGNILNDSRIIKYTLTGIKDGEDGVCYRLSVEPNIIKWIGIAEYDINTITAKVTKYKGEQAIETTDGITILYKLFYYKSDNIINGIYTNQITLPTDNRVDRVTFYVYNGNVTWDTENKVLLDSETVSIVNGIAAKGDPGMQGPITRFTAWKAGRYYYNGKTPAFSTDTNDDTITNNYYLDYVYYAVGNKQYWKCVKTNQVLSSEANKPGVSDCWESISSYEVLATGTLLVGKDKGWIIDNGVIKHTSGNITLNENGTITAASGNFIVAEDGAITAVNANINGTITSEKGKIGPWTLNEYGLHGTSTSITEDGVAVWTGPKSNYTSRIIIGVMGSLSYAEQERTGIDVSLFKDANSNGIYEGMYFIKNAAIQTHTASTYDYYTYSIYANNGVFGGFRPSIAYITEKNGFLTGNIVGVNHDPEFSWEIPDDITVIIIDFSKNINGTLLLPKNPKHGQYYKIINKSGSNCTVNIKSQDTNQTANIYDLYEGQWLNEITRTTNGTWEMFYVATCWSGTAMILDGKWYVTYTKAN